MIVLGFLLKELLGYRNPGRNSIPVKNSGVVWDFRLETLGIDHKRLGDLERRKENRYTTVRRLMRDAIV